MNGLLINVLLALAWVALTGTFTPSNFAIGFGIGYALLWFSQRLMEPSPYLTKVPKAIEFFAFFIKEMTVANLRVARMVLSPRMKMRPAVVAVPLDARSPTEITLLANLLTLTPGTLYLDVSADRCVMYVHTVDVDNLEDFRRSIKDGFERRVLELLR